MALVALTTANKVNVGNASPNQQHTVVAAEAIVAGAPCTFDTNGRAVNSAGNTGGRTTAWGIATATVAAGQAVTIIHRGFMDGWDFTSQAYFAPIFVSDTQGRLGDAAGTTSIQVGRVLPAYAHLISGGAGPDKVLFVDCPF